jgi:hypothetical protein
MHLCGMDGIIIDTDFTLSFKGAESYTIAPHLMRRADWVIGVALCCYVKRGK